MEQKAAKIVSSSILGMDFETIVVNGKYYVVYPPTIYKIAGAAYCLTDLDDASSVKELLQSLKNIGCAARALSYLIKGDDSLYEELAQGPLDEIVKALETCYSLISVENFLKLSILAKNVANLTAKQRQ